MRGSEATCADAGGAQHGGRICADGSFAIGAGDVDRFPAEGAILDQAADASQARRNHVIIVIVGMGKTWKLLVYIGCRLPDKDSI